MNNGNGAFCSIPHNSYSIIHCPMSRIGKKPIIIPAGVEVKIEGKKISIKGPKGALDLNIHELVSVSLSDTDGIKAVNVAIQDSSDVKQKALWGLTGRLILNMVMGVTAGFEEKLEVNGVGFRVAVSGNNLKLEVGFSHPVNYVLPQGISAVVEKNIITISGFDKQLVGEAAAQIRKIKPPEPYKGKGIKYIDEVIRRKAGKAVKAAA